MTVDAKKLSESRSGMGRRRFLNSAALAGLAGVGVAACSDKPAVTPASGKSPTAGEPNATHLKPGELDTYYGLWSGGH